MTNIHAPGGPELLGVPGTALYFPYIQVPPNPWFSRVLLYWEQAATIVPQSMEGDQAMINTYMRGLLQEGLLREVRPEEALDGRESDFTEAFLQHLADQPPPGRKPLYYRVHVGKMPPAVFNELCDQKLAYQLPDENEWRMVEQNVAERYMAYLSSFISARNPGMFPVTDRVGTLPALLPKTRALPQGQKQQVQRLRYAVINDVLPAPSGPVPPAELRQFKQDNRHLLQQCMDELNHEMSVITAQDDPDWIRELEQGLKRRISGQVTELQEQMTRRRWVTRLFKVSAVVGGGPGIFDALAATGEPISIGARAGLEVLGSAEPVREAVTAMREPRIDRSKPMAYAVMASRLPTRT